MEASTATAPAPADTPSKVAELGILNATHRCDKGGCGARAFTRISIATGDLYWCGHHYPEMVEQIGGKVEIIEVLDERYKLVKPSTAVL